MFPGAKRGYRALALLTPLFADVSRQETFRAGGGDCHHAQYGLGGLGSLARFADKLSLSSGPACRALGLSFCFFFFLDYSFARAGLTLTPTRTSYKDTSKGWLRQLLALHILPGFSTASDHAKWG